MATRVLVVEDEAHVSKQIALLLEEYGFEVPAIARSGAESLELVKEHTPHLCLMDICIDGDIDGIETASRMVANHSLPIIFFNRPCR